MFQWEPEAFSLWDWWLYGFGLYCCGGLVWFWFRFQRLEAAIEADEPKAVQRFHAALRGFPNSVYAKMLGKRALEDGEARESGRD